MGHKILLVEDEADLRENFKEILEMNGFEVQSSSNALDALKALDEESFDLIVSDILMPTMNGYEFLAKVRARKELVNVPFLFLTAKVSKEEMRQGMEGGAEDYLVKPIFELELVKAVNASIKKRQDRLDWIESTIAEIVDTERNVKFHELRTPLFGMLSTLDYLTKLNPKDLADPEHVALLKVAYKSAERLNRSLLKLKLYQELTSLKHPPGKILSIKKSIAQAIRTSGLTVPITYEGPDFSFAINEQLWTFILHELLDNCIKFSPLGSEITVSLSRYGLAIKNKQDYLEPNYNVPIRPFGQIKRAFFEYQGLGLGLYICKEYLAHSRSKIHAFTDKHGDFVVELELFVHF